MKSIPPCALLAALALSLPVAAQLEPGSDPVALGPLGGQAISVVAHPQNSDEVLVVHDSPPTAQGLYRSTDAGVTFAPHGQGLPSWIADLTSVPGTDDLYVIDKAGDRVMKSVDFGATWSATAVVPDPNETGLKGLAVAPTGDLLTFDAFSVYRSTDGGATWSESLSVVPGSGILLGSACYAPSDASVAYVGAFGTGIYRSSDGGATFTDTGSFSEWVQTLSVSPTDADVVLAGTYGQGPMRSTDGGATFTAIGNAVTEGNPEWFAWEPDGGLWYATLETLVYSADAGQSWVDVSAGVANVFVPIPMSMAIAANGVRYLGAAGGGLYDQSGGGLYRMDAGPVSSWDHIGFLLALINDVTIASPGGARVIGVGSGVYASGPGEAPFPTAWHADLGTDTRSIAVHPSTPDRWVTGGVGAFIGNAQIVVVTNAGASFVKTYEQLDAGAVQVVSADPFDADHYVAGIFPGAFGNESILVSSDAGASWTEVPGTVGWATRDVAFDPYNPGRVIQVSDNGLSDESLDGGLTWTSIPENWPGNGGAMLVAFDRFEPGVIYRGTTGAGLVRSDDGGASWASLGVSLQMESDLVLHPEMPGLLWVSDADGQVLVSADRGDTFAVALDVPLGRDGAAMAIDPADGTLLVGTNGAAMWELPGASPVVKLGDGTAGSGGFVPRHYPNGGLPQIGNGSYGLAGDGIVGGATVFFALGLSTVNVNAYGGTFYVGDIVVLPAFVVGGTPGAPGEGSFVAPLPIPNQPSAVGLEIVTQFAVVDPGAAHFSGIVVSDALITRLHD